MSGPQPLSQLICDFCGHLWRKHMDTAADLHDEGPVDYKHCAFLLMTDGKSTVGPGEPERSASPALGATKYGFTSGANAPVTVTGPTGPPGRNGLDGKDGRSVVSAHITVQKEGTKFLNLVMSDGTIITVGGTL